jgi:hypothetical protein
LASCPCTQGHFQIILNPTRSPLVQWRLRMFDRIMYCSGCWSYTVGAITTPVFIAIPFLTIWIGALPTPSPPFPAWLHAVRHKPSYRLTSTV